MSRDSWKPFARSLAVALVAVALAAGFAVAQVADPEGDADVPCVDLVSVDVTSTTTSLDVTATMSPRPYPPEYVIDGVDDPNEIRLCPGGLYEVQLDTNGDGEADQRLRLFFDYHGEPTVAGPDSLQVDYSIRHGEVTWHLDLADLGLEELPATIGLRVEAQVVNDGSFKPLVDVDAEDSFPDTWQDVIVGAAAARLIGPAGGMVEVPDEDEVLGGTYLEVPPEALEQIAPVYLDEGDPRAPENSGLAFQPSVFIGPSGLSFKVPAMLHYALHGVAHPGSAREWAFYRYDEDYGWAIIDDPVVLENAGEPNEVIPPIVIAAGIVIYASYALAPGQTRCLHYDDGTGEWKDVEDLQLTPGVHEPVVLVHGFQALGDNLKICGPAESPDDTFGNLASMLSRRDVPVFALTYHTGRPIEDSGDLLHECVTKVTGFSPTGKVRLLAHSEGGLVARTCIENWRLGDRIEEISRYMTLSTPHQGANLTDVKLCAGQGDMQPCSEFLEGGNPVNDGLNDRWRSHGLIDLGGGRQPQYWILGADHDWVVDRDSMFGMRCEDAANEWDFSVSSHLSGPHCADQYTKDWDHDLKVCRVEAACYDFYDNPRYVDDECPEDLLEPFTDPLPELFPPGEAVYRHLVPGTSHAFSGLHGWSPIANIEDIDHPSWCDICRFATDTDCAGDGCHLGHVLFADDFGHGFGRWIDRFGLQWFPQAAGRSGVAEVAHYGFSIWRDHSITFTKRKFDLTDGAVVEAMLNTRVCASEPCEGEELGGQIAIGLAKPTDNQIEDPWFVLDWWNPVVWAGPVVWVDPDGSKVEFVEGGLWSWMEDVGVPDACSVVPVGSWVRVGVEIDANRYITVTVNGKVCWTSTEQVPKELLQDVRIMLVGGGGEAGTRDVYGFCDWVVLRELSD